MVIQFDGDWTILKSMGTNLDFSKKKDFHELRKSFLKVFLVGTIGFEPTTSTVSR